MPSLHSSSAQGLWLDENHRQRSFSTQSRQEGGKQAKKKQLDLGIILATERIFCFCPRQWRNLALPPMLGKKISPVASICSPSPHSRVGKTTSSKERQPAIAFYSKAIGQQEGNHALKFPFSIHANKQGGTGRKKRCDRVKASSPRRTSWVIVQSASTHSEQSSRGSQQRSLSQSASHRTTLMAVMHDSSPSRLTQMLPNPNYTRSHTGFPHGIKRMLIISGKNGKNLYATKYCIISEKTSAEAPLSFHAFEDKMQYAPKKGLQKAKAAHFSLKRYAASQHSLPTQNRFS